MPDGFAFRLTATDGAARSDEVATPHGVVHLPALMPVGTQAAFGGLSALMRWPSWQMAGAIRDERGNVTLVVER
jgi:hypothetical protein